MLDRINFVSKVLTERTAKLSMALREKGYKTAVFYSREKNDVEYETCFDDAIKVQSAEELERALRFLKSRFLHVYSPAVDDFALVAFKSGKRIVFDFKDFLIATHYLGADVPADVRLQKLMIESAAAVVYRDWQLPLAVKRGFLALPKSRVFFPDFCWSLTWFSGSFRQDVETYQSDRLAIVGNHAIERLRPDRRSFGIYKTILLLLDQGFSVRYYPFPHGVYDYIDYINLERSSRGAFAIKSFMPPWELQRELSGCGWGLYVNQFMIFPEYRESLPFDVAHLDCSLGSRVFDYVGAGLPVLSTRHGLIGRLLTRFRVGLQLDGQDFFRLRSRLQSVDIDEMRKAAHSAGRHQLNVSRQINRLVKVYSVL